MILNHMIDNEFANLKTFLELSKKYEEKSI